MSERPVEVSVVLPCLNESDTVASCVERALEGLRRADAVGEVIVADNGSTDDSRELARTAGARVVEITDRGYGAALMGGIAAARGRYVIMGDADGSYDFHEIPRFVEKLRQGYALVQGCRLPVGGGTVLPGAMPFLHRWWGNPMFSAMARRWFNAPIDDVYCGLRGFSVADQQRLEQRCTGMEFANEMVIKMSMARMRIAQVPITLHPDGRLDRAPHLRTWRDGWRTLRFYLLLSPRRLFLLPGITLMLLGVIACVAGYAQLQVGRATFDIKTMLFGGVFVSLGFQLALFAILTKVFAINERLLPADPLLSRVLKAVNVDTALLGGVLSAVVGSVALLLAFNDWREVGFGPFGEPQAMRQVIVGSLLLVLGVQLTFATFFLGVLGLQRRVAGGSGVLANDGLGEASE